jgi:hypothetical protein
MSENICTYRKVYGDGVVACADLGRGAIPEVN